MPIKKLIEDLMEVGRKYPKKPDTMWDKFRVWDKHDNQPAANQLKEIHTFVDERVPERLQEVQLLLGLVKVLNTKDFVYSTKLMTGIKAALSEYPSFGDLDAFLPEKSDKTCPEIKDLRDALIKFGELLRHSYETDRDVNVHITKKAMNA